MLSCFRCLLLKKRMMILSLFFIFSQNSQAGAIALFKMNKMGDILEIATPIYAYGMASMEDGFEGVIQLTKSLFAAQLLIEATKALKIEERPSRGDRKSFPSGHTAAAFSAARYTHLRYGWKKAIVPYTMAAITGWQRIAVNAHYPHDVLAGVLIAFVVNDLFVTPYLPKNLSLNISNQHIGLRYNVSF